MGYKEKLKRNLRLYYLIDFLVGLDFAIPTWVAFQSRILNFTEIGLLHAYVYGLQLLLELPTGALADMLGRKKTVFLGWFLQGAGAIYVAFAQDISMFFISYTLQGIGAALVSGAEVALLYDTHIELKNEAGFSSYIARASFIFRMGLSLGTFAGGYLYQVFVGLPYIAMGICNFLALIFIALLVEPKIDTEKFNFANYIRQTKDGFREIWKSGYMKKLSIFYLLAGGISWSCVAYFNQPLAKELGFDEVQQGWLFGFVYLAVSLSVLFLATRKSLITRSRVYLVLPIIMFTALFLGAFEVKLLAPLIFFMLVFSTSSRFAFLDRFTNEEFESKYRATAISALNMLVGIFYVIAVTLGGKVQDIYGNGIIYGSLGIIALLIMFPLGINLAKHKTN